MTELQQYYIDSVECMSRLKDRFKLIKEDIDSGVNIVNYDDKCKYHIKVIDTMLYQIKMFLDNYGDVMISDSNPVNVPKLLQEVRKYLEYYRVQLTECTRATFYTDFNYIRDSVRTMEMTIKVRLNSFKNEFKTTKKS